MFLMGVQGKKKHLITFLEVVVVSGYPCCVKQLFEQELTGCLKVSKGTALPGAVLR